MLISISLFLEAVGAAILDVRFRRIPNCFLAGCLVWNLVLCFLVRGTNCRDLFGSLIWLVFLPLWKRGVLGAGDLKLFAVLGVLIPNCMLEYLWWTFAVGTVWGVVFQRAIPAKRPLHLKHKIPLAPAGMISVCLYLGGVYH